MPKHQTTILPFRMAEAATFTVTPFSPYVYERGSARGHSSHYFRMVVQNTSLSS